MKIKRICKKCNIEKNIDEFPMNIVCGKEYIRYECKKCKSLRFKKWTYDNKENIKNYKKEYNNINKEKIKNYLKQNKEENNKKRNIRRNIRMKSDPMFRAKKLFRDKLNKYFKKINAIKKNKTSEILGCSFKEFMMYIEKQWLLPHNLNNDGNVWMNWENRGHYNGEPNYGWDIDHIIPLASAKTEEDVIRLHPIHAKKR